MNVQEIYGLIKQADQEGISIVPLKISRATKTRAKEFLKMPFGRARIIDENIKEVDGKREYVYIVHCPVDNLRKIMSHYLANGWVPTQREDVVKCTECNGTGLGSYYDGVDFQSMLCDQCSGSGEE